MIFVFDGYELDLDRFQLRRGGTPVPVEPQVFDVLGVLVRERRRVVTKDELLDTVWGNRFVSESALTSRVKAARRAIGDDGRGQRLIRTVHGRGYQFVGPVTERPTGSPVAATDAAPTPLPAQQIRFCTARDGTRLAYATIGDGPPLVKAANWLSHLDYDWESPVWRHWLIELSRRFHLVRYDERGCGLSDWEVPRFSFDEWVDDLETVVDATGLDRFPLLGISQGGPVAIAYAVRHPERSATWYCSAPSPRAGAPGPAPRRSGSSPRPASSWSGWAGGARIPHTGRRSWRGSCRRPPRTSGARSTSFSADPPRRPTRGASWRSSPTSTSWTWPLGSPHRR